MSVPPLVRPPGSCACGGRYKTAQGRSQGRLLTVQLLSFPLVCGRIGVEVLVRWGKLRSKLHMNNFIGVDLWSKRAGHLVFTIMPHISLRSSLTLSIQQSLLFIKARRLMENGLILRFKRDGTAIFFVWFPLQSIPESPSIYTSTNKSHP